MPAYLLSFPGKTPSAHDRNVRGAVWRLHADLELLREVGRHWNSDPEILDRGALRDLLEDVSRRLVATHRGGVDQPALLAIVESVRGFDRTELYDLAISVGRRSRGLARRLELILERSAAARIESVTLGTGSVFAGGDVVMGDKNKFDFHGPASGIFGSHNQSSGGNFRASTGGGWEELDRELAALEFRVEGEDREAVQSFRRQLETSPEEQKRALLPAVHETIKTWGPVAAAALAVINQIMGMA
ncbi:hypothetical protein GXB85_05990 [Cellulomonas sp. APG4]|uniref:hypothetical protein n=1 Tax=Cellulomonas sp. APG4 TaxID=1538656 RepID=UPI00137B2D50|nr:hypothetical protein [Cellulomonas sp. APG4]NCT90495.1 hypothetical protein [Cellulomonas sp. APG4]